MASYSHSPTHFFVRKNTCLPNHRFRCHCTTPDKKATSRNQGGPHLSFSVWLTVTNTFNVPTSSALNVNSSEFSLTVTSRHPSGTFGFRTFDVPVPRFRYQTSRARSLSIFMKSCKPSVTPSLLPSPRFVTMFCMRPSPSSCWFASNFNALIKFAHRP